jgi:enamine deaminase RidA (YjgF/YER057c/UK114 family)
MTPSEPSQPSPSSQPGPSASSQPPGQPATWETAFGCSRVVAAGDTVLVSGTLPVGDDGFLLGEGSPYEQTSAAYGRALEALRPFGLDASSVIRTRTYLTHVRDIAEAGRAHQEIFGDAAPAGTVLVVSGLPDPRALVQVELEALRGPGA